MFSLVYFLDVLKSCIFLRTVIATVFLTFLYLKCVQCNFLNCLNFSRNSFMSFKSDLKPLWYKMNNIINYVHLFEYCSFL